VNFAINPATASDQMVLDMFFCDALSVCACCMLRACAFIVPVECDTFRNTSRNTNRQKMLDGLAVGLQVDAPNAEIVPRANKPCNTTNFSLGNTRQHTDPAPGWISSARRYAAMASALRSELASVAPSLFHVRLSSGLHACMHA
jgi:hypothetical protein